MKTAICTCIKDEQAYLKEWLDYHLNLGFDHIYLYEDHDSTSHNDIVKNYDNVTLLPIRVVMGEEEHIEGRQMKSVRYSLKILKGQYDWVAFIDLDEFIRLEEGLSLHELLDRYKNYDGIYLSWKMFGACGHIKKPEGSVQENYTTPELEVNFGNFLGSPYLHKSFANLNRNPSFNCIHTVRNGINMDGGTCGKIGIYHTAWIDHYFTKSWEEWCDRIFRRGDLCNGNRKLNLFFLCNPSFKEQKDKMIAEVAHLKPKGKNVFWLDSKTIAGGNVKTINDLNKQFKYD